MITKILSRLLSLAALAAVPLAVRYLGLSPVVAVVLGLAVGYAVAKAVKR